MIGCLVPIQQAGMAALANPELAAAVSEAGALGMVSVGGLPPEKVTRELELVRKRTSRPFGANFLIPGLT
ncbi:enoyl-[acyl-carrier-protein] reductase FabK, partial [Candidatus Bathyarchaeota archaeon]